MRTKKKRAKQEIKYKLDHKLNLKQHDPILYLLDYDLDLKSNHIYLFGREDYMVHGDDDPGVEYAIANRFIRNINLCMRVNPEVPLLIHMKTNGGSWQEGMAIYDSIRSFPYPVTILNYTQASSMSSLLLLAGNKRVMMPNSHFMFHDGSTVAQGTMKQVRSQVKFERNSDRVMLEIYAKSMKYHGKMANKSIQNIKKWLRAQMDRSEEVYLTAKETVELGFADEIFNADWSSLTKYTEEQLNR